MSRPKFIQSHHFGTKLSRFKPLSSTRLPKIYANPLSQPLQPMNFVPNSPKSSSFGRSPLNLRDTPSGPAPERQKYPGFWNFRGAPMVFIGYFGYNPSLPLGMTKKESRRAPFCCNYAYFVVFMGLTKL